MNNAVILVAGGVGKRFGTSIPKQFLLLNDKPIYLHTIERFISFDSHIQLILVLPMRTSAEELKNNQRLLAAKYNANIKTCVGGVTRFDSVKNGLRLINHDIDVVAVHDAVRPLVSQDVINKSFITAFEKGNAVPGIKLTNSVRKINGAENKAVNRDDYRLVQTPQCFRKEQIMSAYDIMNQPEFTDDATVVEQAGFQITMVEGNVENIKITTPPDLLYAEFILQQQKRQ